MLVGLGGRFIGDGDGGVLDLALMLARHGGRRRGPNAVNVLVNGSVATSSDWTTLTCRKKTSRPSSTRRGNGVDMPPKPHLHPRMSDWFVKVTFGCP